MGQGGEYVNIRLYSIWDPMTLINTACTMLRASAIGIIGWPRDMCAQRKDDKQG